MRRLRRYRGGGSRPGAKPHRRRAGAEGCGGEQYEKNAPHCGSIAVQYALAVAGFALGLLIAVGYDRRLRRQGGLSFTIVRLF